MSIGHTCDHLNVEGVQYTFLPSCVTADAYIFTRVHLLRCSAWFEPLLDQHFYSLLTCNAFLQGNTRVTRDRPHVTTRQLS